MNTPVKRKQKVSTYKMISHFLHQRVSAEGELQQSWRVQDPKRKIVKYFKDLKEAEAFRATLLPPERLCRCGTPIDYTVKKNSAIFCSDKCAKKKYEQGDKPRHKYWSKKRALVDSFGGKCMDCGDERLGVLTFHHLDPSEKSFNVLNCGSLSLEKLKVEAAKCVCLCRNCHGLRETDDLWTTH